MDVSMELKDKSYLDSLLVEMIVNNFIISKESKFGVVVGSKSDCSMLKFNFRMQPIF